MHRRAEHVDETRRRIAEAAMRLHTTVGPSGASISSIAEAAGVTRLTVYRHFKDQDEIFAACMAHWATLHPRPDAARWTEIDGLEARARLAVAEVYAWYAEVAEELAPIHRDLAHVPERGRTAIRSGPAAMADIVASAAADSTRRRVRAAAVLAFTLSTYRLLVHQERLSGPEAVELQVRAILAAEHAT